MKSKLQEITLRNSENSSIWKPSFYRLNSIHDKNQINELLNKPGIILHDEILGQVQELVKTLNPKIVFSKQDLAAAALKHFANVPHEEYGVWVYYPWSNKLVHILDEEEFVLVRTSRNQYKITPEEQKTLRTKKIGVIGLSVGQSVSVTLAMERICGEIRLTDFDILELTNLNRIRTGIHNLGLAKVYSVAREISEIDPFVKVKCYPQGLSEENLDDFFMTDGKLDLLVEESDGFDIKILSRIKAKELRVPVIMEASDKCMIDVERFDLEPDRNILHGLVNHLDISTLKKLKTNEEKIPFMLDILGLETASLRLKASMLEIEQTINTWPQLASAVTMGGGITADISRRMLLNQYTQSGRFHIDIEELVGDKKGETIEPAKFQFPELSNNSMNDVVSKITKVENNSRKISNDLILIWIADAIKAPSAGNNQPWKWYLDKTTLYLFHDKHKSYSWSDPSDHLAHLALGACLENLTLSALHSGYESEIKYFNPIHDNLLVSQICFSEVDPIKQTDIDKKLYSAINLRCTNRKKGNKEIIEINCLKAIVQSVSDDYEIIFIENEKQINELAEIVSSVEKLRFIEPNGHHDFFKNEIRWTPAEVNKTKDGLDIDTLELSLLDRTGLKVASNPEVISKIREWNGGGGLQKITRDAVKSASAVGLIRSKNTIVDFVKAGREVERAWLMANQQQLAFHPISSPVFFFNRMNNGNDLNENLVADLKLQEKKFKEIFGRENQKTDIFLFRLSKSDAPTTISLRRSLNKSVIISEK